MLENNVVNLKQKFSDLSFNNQAIHTVENAIPQCDELLLVNLKNLVRHEKQITTQILDYLEAVEVRRLYIQRGYSSLFAFCVGELKYSESSAQRRISSMRLSKDLPIVKAELQKGTLNLSTVSQLQAVMTRHEKTTKVKISLDDKMKLVEKIKNQSQTQVQRTLAETFPEQLPLEKTRAVTEDHQELKLFVSQECFEKLNQLKDFFSHALDQPTLSSLLEHMTEQIFDKQMKKLGLSAEVQNVKSQAFAAGFGRSKNEGSVTRVKKIDDQSFQMSAKKTTSQLFDTQVEIIQTESVAADGAKLAGDSLKTPVSKCTSAADVKMSRASDVDAKISSASAVEVRINRASSLEGMRSNRASAEGVRTHTSRKRHIPTATKKLVWKRDQGKCQYVDIQTGKKCESTHRIQVDHQFPFAAGGAHSLNNSRLLCNAHNLWLGERFFNEAW